MSKRICAAVVILMLFLLGTNVYARPEVSAHSVIVTEKNTGRVLYEKNAEQRMPMASTTKIMTAIAALESEIPLDDLIEISAQAANVEGSSMYLKAGEKLTMRELLYGLMLSSGNDAAVAVAEAVSGTQEEFVKLMNEKAMKIGAKNTHFTNPNGLPDDGHYSTASDMAKLTSYALSNSTFAEIVSTQVFKIEGPEKAYPRTLTNHNKLLKMYDGCKGVKTGFTKAAGRCLVSAAEREGMTLICVTLNAPDDWNDHMQLFDYAFENYKYKKIISCDIPICTAYVNGAINTEVDVYSGCDIHFPLEEHEGYSVETEIYPGLSAPLKDGEQVGRLIIEMTGRKAEIPLIVRNEVEVEHKAENFGTKIAKRIKNFFVEWLNMV